MTPLLSSLTQLKRSRFVYRLFVLSGGMTIGQGLLLLSTPLLTRLYTPESFGVFAVFGALSSIFITVVALRYEQAVPLEQNDRIAAALVVGSVLASLLVSLLACLAVLFGGAALARRLAMPDLASLLWLLPPCLLLWGVGSAVSLWAIRRGAIRTNGVNRVLHYAAQAGGQSGLGVLGSGAAGLVLGYALGYLVRAGHLLTALRSDDRLRLPRVSFGEVVRGLRRHWRFPAFAAGAALLQATSAMLPVVLIAFLYGPLTAGLFGLAQRVVGLPLRLVGESASHVFLGEIRTLDHAGMIRLFKRVAVLFASFGALGMLPLLWAAPPLFAFVFGEAWRDAGVIVQLLVPLYLTRFVVMPVSQTLNAVDRQDLHLVASLLNVVALCGSFAAGYGLALPAEWTIGLLSLASTAAFLFYIGMAWRDLQRADWQKLRRAE